MTDANPSPFCMYTDEALVREALFRVGRIDSTVDDMKVIAKALAVRLREQYAKQASLAAENERLKKERDGAELVGKRYAFGRTLSHLRSIVPLLKGGGLRDGIQTAIDETVELYELLTKSENAARSGRS